MPNPYDKQIQISINSGVNRVRRALEVANQRVGQTQVGVRLNTTSSALINTVTSVKTGLVNQDRYLTEYQKPKVSAAFSFAIDGSDSMNYNCGVPAGSYWKECVSILNALHTSCQSLGVDSTSGLVMYTYGREDVPMASTNYSPVINLIKGIGERWKKDYPDQLRKKRCNGGTSIVSYGEAAIDMLSNSYATHKIAFFLTDGEDYEKMYMESMRLQALSKGIKLVGIGLGVNGDKLPNGISGSSAMDIAPRMMTHLEKIILSNKGVQSDDQ